MTVLLSVYNDRPYLPEAVGSILAQTLPDLELLVIDDGSTDESASYLAGVHDRRLRVVRNERNTGLTGSLNTGLKLATGCYVARMDADDVAERDRLRRQVELLESRGDVGIVGTARALIDECGSLVAHAAAAVGDLAVRWKCLLGNPLAHPTVMIRREVLEQHGLRYDEAFATAQDYELWTRLLAVTKGENINEPLLRYRLRKSGVSATRKAEQLANHDRIAYSAIRRLLPGAEITPEEVTQLRGRFGGHSVREPDMDPSDMVWLAKYGKLHEAFVAAYAGAAAIRDVV